MLNLSSGRQGLLFAAPFAMLCCVGAAQAGYVDVVKSANPVGFWQFNEKTGTIAYDSSGIPAPPARDGQYNSGVTLGVPGPVAGSTAADFDGATGSVIIPPNSDYNQLTNNFTITAWIKPNGVNGIQNILSTRELIGDAGGWALVQVDDRLSFNPWGIEGAGGYSPHVISSGYWQQIAVVFDSSNASNFYVNGDFVGSAAGVAPVNPNGQALYVGQAAAWWGGPEHFSGGIADVAIFHGALTADQIHDQYLAALAPTPVPGDANGDGKVTGADYTIWAAYYSLQPTNATFAQGDFNGDGKVTGADYTIWAANFTPVATATITVPEPATAMLIGVGTLAALAAAARRRHALAMD